jgi:hypothetical protein
VSYYPYSVRVVCLSRLEQLIQMRQSDSFGITIVHEFGERNRFTYLWDLTLRISRVSRSRAECTASTLLSRTGFLLALRNGLTIASIVVLVLRALLGSKVVGGVVVWGGGESTRLRRGLALTRVIVVLRLRVVRRWDLLAEWIVWLLRWRGGLRVNTGLTVPSKLVVGLVGLRSLVLHSLRSNGV